MGDLASRRKANSYRNQSLAFVLLGIFVILVGIYVNFFLIFISFIFFAISGHFWNKQKTWHIGARGEESVIRVLRKLDPSFKVVNDVFLPGNGGNIDHVVVGPIGVFAIETKNHNGMIKCYGDNWTRKKVGRRGTVYYPAMGSPSKQVKRNAVMLKEWLESKNLDVGNITAVVVFTNRDLELKVIRPTVSVVYLKDLLGVFNGQSNYKMTEKKINFIAKKLYQLK